MKASVLELQPGDSVNWSDFEQSLHDRFGVNAVALQPNGERRTQGALLPANDICRIIKESLKAESAICATLKRRLLHTVRTRKRYAADECDAGIYRLIMPVLLADAIEGFISVCGRPFSTTDRLYPETIHRATAEGERRIRSLLPTLRPIGPRELKEIRLFISEFAH